MALQELPPYARNRLVIRYARMCAYMERASFGALSSFMYPLLCRFMHDLFLFLFFSLASRSNRAPSGLRKNGERKITLRDSGIPLFRETV